MLSNTVTDFEDIILELRNFVNDNKDVKKYVKQIDLCYVNILKAKSIDVIATLKNKASNKWRCKSEYINNEDFQAFLERQILKFIKKQGEIR